MSIIDEIKILQEKKEKAQTLITRYKTQLETLISDRDDLINKLEETYGTTIDGAKAKLVELETKRDELLAEAKKALDNINL